MKATILLKVPVSKGNYSYEEVAGLLPEAYRLLITRNEASNTGTAQDLFMWVNTQAGNLLDVSCAAVMRFIIARTYGYRKQAELIAVSHLIEGVWRVKDGTSICAPAVKSERTARKALEILEKIGYITRHRVVINHSDHTSLIEVHADVVLRDSVIRTEVGMLRQSRKSKVESDDFMREDVVFADKNSTKGVLHKYSRGVLHKCTPAPLHKCRTEDVNIEDVNSEEIKNPSCSVPRNEVRPVSAIDCKSKIEGVVAKATARVTRLRNVKVERAALGAMISLSDLNATWKQAMISAYGSCTVAGLTVKEYGMFRRTVKTHTLDCSWKEFFTWAISNWRQINKESLALSEYRKKKSGEWSLKDEQTTFLGTKAPDLFMLVKNYGKLLKRFSQKGLEGRGAASEDTEEVKALKAKLEATTRQETVNRQLLDKALRAKQAVPATPRPPPRIVVTVNPEHDQFFQGDDDDMLPVWK